MNLRRVVITGMGAVSCAGNSVPELWESLVNNRSGIGKVTLFDATDLGCPAGEVRDFTLAGVTPKEARRMARFVRFAVGAADEARRMAKLEKPATEASFRYGVLVASGSGGLDEYDGAAAALAGRGVNAVSPFFIPKFIVNCVSGTLAAHCGWRGVNFCPASACSSGSHSIGEAAWIIRRGDADVMLAGGSEACLTKLMMSGFNSLTALSRNPVPERACRPFDRDRDGFVMAEGAGVLVLEELEHALRRGAPILAEVAGYGASCDAYHMTAPDPEGAGMAQALRTALEHAGVAPEAVGAVSAHGTGTVANDRCETRALKSVFGAHAGKLKVTAIKSMIGHAFAAAGAFATIAAVRSLQSGLVPPTLNYEHPDPECDLDVVAGNAARVDTGYMMVNALGFGGHNTALLLKKWDD